MSKKYNFEDYQNIVKKLCPNLTVIKIGERNLDPITIYCNKCGQTYKTTLKSLKRNPHCQICAGVKIIRGYNTLGDLHPDLVKYFKESQEAFEISSGSRKTIELKCPLCGEERKIRAADLVKQGWSCRKCGDLDSYPNRFLRSLMFALEKQMDDFMLEYVPKWSKRKRYDGYFKKDNKSYLIEMQGIQHYCDSAWSTKEAQEDNDLLKKKMAKENNFQLIVINCSQSKFEFIKKEIEESLLKNIFDLSLLNWDKIGQNAEKSIVKEVCEAYKNKTKYTGQLCKEFHVYKTTIIRYLKRRVSIGLLTKEEERLRCKKRKKYFYCVFNEDWEKLYIGLGVESLFSYLKKQGVEITISMIKNRVCLKNPVSKKSYHGYYFRKIGNDYDNPEIFEEMQIVNNVRINRLQATNRFTND